MMRFTNFGNGGGGISVPLPNLAELMKPDEPGDDAAAPVAGLSEDRAPHRPASGGDKGAEGDVEGNDPSLDE